jgi:hypothetical protein
LEERVLLTTIDFNYDPINEEAELMLRMAGDGSSLDAPLELDQMGRLVLQGSSSLIGTGTIDGDVINGGLVSPGNSPGIQNFHNFTQDETGALLIEIAGNGSAGVADGFDQVNVSGAAALSGTLEVQLLDGFVPAVGQTFDFLTFGSVVGDFSIFDGLEINGSIYFEPILDIGTSKYSLEVRATSALDHTLNGGEVTIAIDSSDGPEAFRLVDDGGNVVAEQSVAGTSHIAISGSDGMDDTLILGLDTDQFVRPIRFDGGVGGSDTLAGPLGDATWNVTGNNSGDLEGLAVDFSGVENLAGAADNNDTFIVNPNGSLSGRMDGGAGGFDSLVFEGTYSSVSYTAIDASSGTVDADGDLFTYTGLEPLTMKSGTADVTIDLSALSDDAR